MEFQQNCTGEIVNSFTLATTERKNISQEVKQQSELTL